MYRIQCCRDISYGTFVRKNNHSGSHLGPFSPLYHPQMWAKLNSQRAQETAHSSGVFHAPTSLQFTDFLSLYSLNFSVFPSKNTDGHFLNPCKSVASVSCVRVPELNYVSNEVLFSTVSPASFLLCLLDLPSAETMSSDALLATPRRVVIRKLRKASAVQVTDGSRNRVVAVAAGTRGGGVQRHRAAVFNPSPQPRPRSPTVTPARGRGGPTGKGAAQPFLTREMLHSLQHLCCPAARSPRSPLQAGRQLSACPHRRGPTPLIIFVATSIPIPTGPSPSCTPGSVITDESRSKV